jgi:uncharacterized protein (TIGR03437 family)
MRILIPARVAILFLCLSAASAADLILEVSTETAPPGGWAQIKMFAAKPQTIASGRIVADLDPVVFGDIQSVGLFSANGDAYGSANLSGQHVDAQFHSDSGSIGQLKDLPILVIVAPVLANASPENRVTVSVNPNGAPWKDVNGNSLPVSVLAGSVTIGGDVSVKTVQFGAGVLPAGTIVPIQGTGFTSSTVVTMDTVAIASTQFIGPNEIDVTLAAPAELNGKKVRLQDSGPAIEYFCFEPGAPDQNTDPLYARTQPLFPLLAWPAMEFRTPSSGGAIALQNPNRSPVEIDSRTVRLTTPPLPSKAATATIPPGSWALYGSPIAYPEYNTFISASLPIRAVLICQGVGAGLPALCPFPVTPSAPPPTPGEQFSAIPGSLSWRWNPGSPPPPPQTVRLTRAPGVYRITASTSSGGNWLSASPGLNYGPLQITATVDPSGLGPGDYTGAIMLIPNIGESFFIPVSLTVGSGPVPPLIADPPGLTFNVPFGTSAQPQTIALSSAAPAKFTFTAPDWLKVMASGDTTPATLSVRPEEPSTSLRTALLFIAGPENQIEIPVQVNIRGPIVSPATLDFSAKAGSAPQERAISVIAPDDAPAISVSTYSGGSAWLSARAELTGALPRYRVVVTLNAQALAPGTYTGAVAIEVASAGTTRVPVRFVVWSAPPALQVSAAPLFFEQPVESSAPPQRLRVESGGAPVRIQVVAESEGNWLYAVNQGDQLTPADILVAVTSSNLRLGEYHGTIRITAESGTVSVPVTLVVTAASAPPLIASIVNGASQAPGPVAPGETLSIHGYAVAPSRAGGMAEVVFDGTPASVVYSSPYHLNVAVPDEIGDRAYTTIEVSYNGRRSAPWGVPVVAAAPAIFTLDRSGLGQAAALNADGSPNGASHPAQRGSMIQVFATGARNSVTVNIGGVDAVVQDSSYATGMLVLNVIVPAVTPGGAVPITIAAGGVRSQEAVTVEVN